MLYQQVIVTGASSGLGEAFARRLAGVCRCLVLTARREERLQVLANELRGQHTSLDVKVEPCDLSQPEARASLKERLLHLPPCRTLLINNAGLGDYGEILTSEDERNRQMMQVNMEALVELSRALLPRLMEQGGGIINVASLAAELPIPDFAVYAASKAFVASFSEALRLELLESGVPVLALCPGPVHTGFGAAARRSDSSGREASFRKWFYTPVDTVVKDALNALEHNRPLCYPSLRISLAARVIRLLPRFLLRRVMSLRPRRSFSH